MPSTVLATEDAPSDDGDEWIRRFVRLGEDKKCRQRDSLCKSGDARRQGATRGVKDQGNWSTEEGRGAERWAGASSSLGEECPGPLKGV